MPDNDNIKEQIKALEKWKDEFRNVDGIVDEYKRSQEAMKEQIKALEKKQTHAIDNQVIFNKNALEQLAELKGQIKRNENRLNTQRDAINNRNYSTIRENQQQLAELKEDLNKHIQYMHGYNTPKEQTEKKEIKICPECGSYYKGIHTLTDCNYAKGEDSKTEKKEDSETLKKIKELAHAESEFYNKHGYFSFWSDKLKAQRIKEMILLKHLKDHKKVSEDQRKGIDIKELFNEFDKANDELIKNLETEKKDALCDECDRDATCSIDYDFRCACKKEDHRYYRKIKLVSGGSKSGVEVPNRQIKDKNPLIKPEEKLPELCKHLNIVPRDDLSYYCKDCGYDTFDIKKDEDGNLTHLLEKLPESITKVTVKIKKELENKCKICGEKSPSEDGFCSSECFEKAQWESKEKPCNRCDHLIENINKYGHFYCRELDMKMDEFVEKCVHSTPKKKEKDYDLGMITSKDGELSIYTPSQFVKDYAKIHKLFSLYGLMFPEEASGGVKSHIGNFSGVEKSKIADDSKLPEPWPIENMEFTTLEEIEESIPKHKEAEPIYLSLKLEKEIDVCGLIEHLRYKISKENDITHPSDYNQDHLKKIYKWKDITKILLRADKSWYKRKELYQKYDVIKHKAEPEKDYSLDDMEKVEK